MIILDSTLKKLQLVTSAAVNTDYYISYVDITTTTFTPAESDGQTTTATTTDVLAAPASSTQRQVKYVSFVNRSATTVQNVNVLYNNNGTTRNITPIVSLNPGEQLQYTQDQGWQVYTLNGLVKVTSALDAGYSGQAANMMKNGTTAQAVNIQHCLALASGFPGAWAAGSPGLSGRTCAGTDATNDGGCMLVKTAVTGRNFLKSFGAWGSNSHTHQVYDFLWVNSGLAVTTTTGQTITSVALPARDVDLSTNGNGVQCGILVTTATTNAGAITNTTLTYTNQAGTGSKTATIPSFPANAKAGTFVPFALASGDTGIKSIQTCTLGTSYGGGAISLVMFRPYITATSGVTSLQTTSTFPDPGIFLPTDVCLIPLYIASATAATTMFYNIVVLERP